MENNKLYNFIGQIALNYRLSLENVCKLLGKNIDDKTKLDVYVSIVSITGDQDLKRAYNYLFNYETINESEISSSIALSKALIYLKRYTKAQKANDKEELKVLNKELNKIESDFKKFKDKKDHTIISEEEFVAIAKYRLKHCVSRRRISEILGVSRDRIINNEKKIADEKLKTKLDLVSNFYQDVYAKRSNRVK